MKYDFGGYVTKNDLQCTDGRIIRHGAFEQCNGKRVPLVWQHMHDSVDNVLGHVDLDVRNDGVYGYCTLNNTSSGQNARELIEHGDIRSMSIYANQLQQRGNEVLHGNIREVSLVLAGANPGATIDNLNFAHDDGSFSVIDEEAIIRMNQVIIHAEGDDPKEDEPAADDTTEAQTDGKTVEDVINTMTEEQKRVMYGLIGAALEQAKGKNGEEMAQADDDGEPMDDADDIDDADGQTVEDVLESMTDLQRKVVYALVGAALKKAGVDPDKEKDNGNQNDPDNQVMSQSSMKGTDNMGHNIFESASANGTQTLSHSEMAAIFDDARRIGSLKDSVLEHGITSIDVLFPEAQAVNTQPEQITRRMEWVGTVLNGVHKSPFSRVEGTAVNMTEEDARAKGYIKGNKKVEEQISALKRVTEPQTVYKLQKLDRDDVVDITDFDVVAFMKAEMRTMLDEEIARAILIGDGRSSGSNDKIKEDRIRPIWKDEETYAVHTKIDTTSLSDGPARAKAFIDAAIRAHKNYKGSGTPTLFVGTDLLTEMRMLRDEIGHRLYKNDQELADELRVSKIVEVEVFDGQKYQDDQQNTLELGGIIVNLSDYNVGATRGGEVSLFDDFDLDYNKLEYLIETRMSGALVKPMSALVVDFFTKKG